MEQAHIIFVDDDETVLEAIQALFADEVYHTEFFLSGEEALDYISENTPHIIVSDLRMPGMNGLDFLKKVQKEHPETLRVILSAFTEREALLEAINSGLVYRYLLKPWDPVELINLVEQMVDLFFLRKEKEVLIDKLEEQNAYLEEKVEARTRQLLAIEKEAELGKYASQIVHNLKIPIQSIGGAVFLAKMTLVEDDPYYDKLREYLDIIHESTSELRKTIGNVVLHSIDQAFFKKEPLDLNDIIENEVEFYHLDPVYKYRVNRELKLSEDLPRLMGNPMQIKQILDNLIKNAIESMEQSPIKRLTIETYSDEDGIFVKVRDTGEGIPKENLGKIFSPYFTTKPLGKGTGLGLASVKKMIEAYRGYIKVESVVNEGSEFTMFFPGT